MVMGAAPGFAVPLAVQVAQMQKKIKILTAKVDKLSKPRRITAPQLNGRYWFQSYNLGTWAGAGFFGFSSSGQNGVMTFRSKTAKTGTFTFTATNHNVTQDDMFDRGLYTLNPGKSLFSSGSINFAIPRWTPPRFTYVAPTLKVRPPLIISKVTTTRKRVRNTGTYRVVGRNKVIIRPKGAPKGVFMEGAATISRETITLIDNKEAGVNGFAVLIKQ